MFAAREKTMSGTDTPLSALSAPDVMTRDVLVISEGMVLQDAVHLLSQNQITGAPVLDVKRRCVGILSATDFFRWVKMRSWKSSPPTTSPRSCPSTL
jgi:CBS domain-containing protein